MGEDFYLISIELSVVVVAIAVAISVIAVILSLAGLLVGDSWAVSVLVCLICNDLGIKDTVNLRTLYATSSQSYLLPAIGQQDVVAADSLVSIAGLHVSKVIARSVIVYVVLEGVLGGLRGCLISTVGVSIVAIGVATAGRTIRGLRLLLGSLLLVRVCRGSVLLARGRGRIKAGCSIIRAWPLLLLGCSVVR